jgi:predicted phosphodiesterase
MKIVIVSDLHANWDALSGLPESFDELWVLGDLVDYGPQPSEVVNFVRDKAMAIVRGNHDHAVGYDQDPRCTPRYHEMAESTRQYTLRLLDVQQKQFLQDLPLALDLERDGRCFSLVHAVPSDPLYGYCPQESDRWAEELRSVRGDILLVGHTHTPFIRRIGKKLVVNPGSLGQPKTGKPEACYAVWNNGEFTLKSCSYPYQKTAERIRQMPVRPEIQQDLITVLTTGSL